MLYDSPHPQADTTRTEWLSGGTMRHNVSYRIFVVCLTQSAQRVEKLVVDGLKSKGAGVRVTSAPAASKEGARTRLVFAVRGSGNVRGAIAAMVNLLGADTCVRTVRWESDPQPA